MIYTESEGVEFLGKINAKYYSSTSRGGRFTSRKVGIPMYEEACHIFEYVGVSESGVITAITKPKVVEGIDLGRFLIEFTLGVRSNQLVVSLDELNVSRMAAVNHMTHPHISNGMAPCLGEGAHAVKTYSRSKNWFGILCVLDQVLDTYNEQSPYLKLEKFASGMCEKCGTWWNVNSKPAPVDVDIEGLGKTRLILCKSCQQSALSALDVREGGLSNLIPFEPRYCLAPFPVSVPYDMNIQRITVQIGYSRIVSYLRDPNNYAAYMVDERYPDDYVTIIDDTGAATLSHPPSTEFCPEWLSGFKLLSGASHSDIKAQVIEIAGVNAFEDGVIFMRPPIAVGGVKYKITIDNGNLGGEQQATMGDDGEVIRASHSAKDLSCKNNPEVWRVLYGWLHGDFRELNQTVAADGARYSLSFEKVSCYDVDAGVVRTDPAESNIVTLKASSVTPGVKDLVRFKFRDYPDKFKGWGTADIISDTGAVIRYADTPEDYIWIAEALRGNFPNNTVKRMRILTADGEDRGQYVTVTGIKSTEPRWRRHMLTDCNGFKFEYGWEYVDKVARILRTSAAGSVKILPSVPETAQDMAVKCAMEGYQVDSSSIWETIESRFTDRADYGNFRTLLLNNFKSYLKYWFDQSLRCNQYDPDKFGPLIQSYDSITLFNEKFFEAISAKAKSNDREGVLSNSIRDPFNVELLNILGLTPRRQIIGLLAVKVTSFIDVDEIIREARVQSYARSLMSNYVCLYDDLAWVAAKKVLDMIFDKVEFDYSDSILSDDARELELRSPSFGTSPGGRFYLMDTADKVTRKVMESVIGLGWLGEVDEKRLLVLAHIVGELVEKELEDN